MQKLCPRVTWNTPPPDDGAIRSCLRSHDSARQGWSSQEQSLRRTTPGVRVLHPHLGTYHSFLFPGSVVLPESNPESSIPCTLASSHLPFLKGREGSKSPWPDPWSSPRRYLAWRVFNVSLLGGRETHQTLKRTHLESSKKTQKAGPAPRRSPSVGLGQPRNLHLESISKRC